jgi:hypothetical protein
MLAPSDLWSGDVLAPTFAAEHTIAFSLVAVRGFFAAFAVLNLRPMVGASTHPTWLGLVENDWPL